MTTKRTNMRGQGSHMKTYGPDLTPKIKDELLAEIAAFDKAKTLADIERNSVSSRDVSAYWSWVENENNGLEPVTANPNCLSESEAISFDRPELDERYSEGKKDIDDILSPRQLQVWRLVMRRGMTYKQAGNLLHVSAGTVKTYFDRSKEKIDRYLGGNNAG